MTAQNDLSRYRSEANRNRTEIGRASSTVAAQRKKAADATTAASRSKSSATIRMKVAEAERATRSANDAEKKRADFEKRLAAVEVKIAKTQENYEKEQRMAQTRSLNAIRSETRRASTQFTGRFDFHEVPVADPRLHVTPWERSLADLRRPMQTPTTPQPQSDVFLSHASEDKEDIARPLKAALEQRGLDVWFDEIRIKPGASIRQEIEAGIANARFGVVIVSPHFFQKEWTQAELNGLFGRKMQSSDNLVIPIWHHISKDEVLRRSPILADIAALNSAISTIDDMASRIADVIRGS